MKQKKFTVNERISHLEKALVGVTTRVLELNKRLEQLENGKEEE